MPGDKRYLNMTCNTICVQTTGQLVLMLAYDTTRRPTMYRKVPARFPSVAGHIKSNLSFFTDEGNIHTSKVYITIAIDCIFTKMQF